MYVGAAAVAAGVAAVLLLLPDPTPPPAPVWPVIMRTIDGTPVVVQPEDLDRVP